MKHLKHWLTIVTVLLCSISANAQIVASGSCGANLTWTLDYEGTFTISGTGKMTDYCSAFECPRWYHYRDLIKQVSIEGNVTSIGWECFSSCKNLTSIVIPESVTSIGVGAFSGCNNLASIVIPKSVTSIDMSAFSGTAWYENQPDGLIYVNNVLYKYKGTMPENTSIVVKDGTTGISREAFRDCSGLIDISIPKSVTSIGPDAFFGTTWDANLPDGLIYINNVLYKYKGDMPENTSIDIREGTIGIAGAAFSYYDNLISVSIPESVVEIDCFAFDGCCNLSSIDIPKNVVKIGLFAFRRCSNLASIVVEEGNTNYDSRNGCNAIIETSTKSLILGCGSTIIPETIETIEWTAFYYCDNLTSIVIPEGVSMIRDFAFDGCQNLSSITLPKSLNSIGIQAFYDCESLTSIVLPEGLTSIGRSAFLSCDNLASISFPNSLNKVSSVAFDNTAWYNEQPNGVVCAGGALYEFKGAMPEESYIVVEDGTVGICEGVFLSCKNLVSIVIPESVTSIWENAFGGCSNLASITIPKGVTSIERYVFSGCSSLASITIPENVTWIGEGAFANCKGLTSLTVNAVIPPAISGGSKTFENVNKSIPVYVPTASVNAYKSSEYWSEFTNIQPISNAYTLTVSSAGYATLYLDYAVEIPEKVEVYIASSVEGDRLMMTEVEGVLPANTGVIVRAKAGEYTFVESDETPAEVEGNLLVGTTANEYITTQSGYKYYVLAQKDGVVGMYRPKLTDGQFLNNANKAYLALDMGKLGIFDDETNTEEEGGQLGNRLRFDFGGTTSIEKTTDNGEQTTIIYDLHGRRITDTEGLKGIYIVNGRKVVI